MNQILKQTSSSGSSYSGAINTENTAKTVSITLDSSSTLTLTGNSYITSLNNEVSDNSNINLNGHTLYVNGKAITSTNYKGATNVTNSNTENATNTQNTEEKSSFNANIILPAIVVIGVIVIVIIIKKIKK